MTLPSKSCPKILKEQRNTLTNLTVLEYIESVYSETKFEYLSFMEVVSQFPDKEDARRQLNELREQGVIRKHPGFTGVIIEYLGDLRKEFELKTKPKNETNH